MKNDSNLKYPYTVFDETGEFSFNLKAAPTITIASGPLEIDGGYYIGLEFDADTFQDNLNKTVVPESLDFKKFWRFLGYPDQLYLKASLDTPNAVSILQPSTANATWTINLNFNVVIPKFRVGEVVIAAICYTNDATSGAIEETDPQWHIKITVQQSANSTFQQNTTANGGAELTGTVFSRKIEADSEPSQSASFLSIGLQPILPPNTKDVSFWTAIRNATDSLSYPNYGAFMDFIFCGGAFPFKHHNATAADKFKNKMAATNKVLQLPFNNVDAYRALKVATEAFVMANLSVAGEPDPLLETEFDRYRRTLTEYRLDGSTETLEVIPYLAIIRQQLQDVDIKFHSFEKALDTYVTGNGHARLADQCYGIIKHKLQHPCLLELIWNYWHEESMMVQGMGTISRRFQNIRGEEPIDPLANLEIGPLRSLNNLLWGYIQDEQHRLTVRRRAYEYNHQYGITLQGKAVSGLRPADSRSKFIEAFHTLLNLCTKFYRQFDDTTVVADGFPVMNALKEVHMILSEGAHNQYGDLPSTSRIEMLMQQYILARPEMREFLLSRQMVAYPEPWMDRVMALNQMHSWTRTNVLHYRDLGVFGEQIVLSIRFGAWSVVFNRDQAANWAIFWRPQIQNYIHAYRAVSGVDLSLEDGRIDVQQPSVHLVRRLKEQNHQKLPSRIGK